MKDSVPDCLLAHKLKYLKGETLLSPKQESMQLLNFWRKSKVSRVKRRKNPEKQSIGLMVSTSYLFTNPKVDLITSFYLLGKTAKASQRRLKSVVKSTFMTFCQILKSPNFQSNAVKLKK